MAAGKVVCGVVHYREADGRFSRVAGPAVRARGGNRLVRHRPTVGSECADPGHVLRHQAGCPTRQYRQRPGRSDHHRGRYVFAPGGDLGGRAEDGESVPEAVGMDILPFLAIRDSRAPVIAAVNGICQAGGLLIAMMADIAVASERATFRVPELLRGIPDALFAAALPAHCGVAVARDLLLSARVFDAAEAKRLGVISRVVAHEQLRTAATDAVREVLLTGPSARTHVKRMLNERYGLIDQQTMSWSLEESDEPREGMRAFMEKRPPRWALPDT